MIIVMRPDDSDWNMLDHSRSKGNVILGLICKLESRMW